MDVHLWGSRGVRGDDAVHGRRLAPCVRNRLQSRGVVRIQRGIGYFVEPGAADRIRSFRREAFMNEELHDFFRQARSIGITADELAALYRQYCEKDHSFQ